MSMKLLLPYALFFILLTNTYAQDFYIKGRVLDADTKEPISFATILVQNKKIGLYASEEGEFSFLMRKEFTTDSLVISSIGFRKIIVPFSELQLNTLMVQGTTVEQLTPIPVQPIGFGNQETR